MIWPARNLVLAILCPALLSLVLLVPGTDLLKTGLLALDAVVAFAALTDLLTLVGAGRLKASRTCGQVASLGEKHPISISIENHSRFRRLLTVKDDLPRRSTPSPASSSSACRPGAWPCWNMMPCRSDEAPMRSAGSTPLASSRLGFWRRSIRLAAPSAVRVYPDVQQIGRYTLLARRDRLSAIGMRVNRRLGNDNEFERLRDYAEGDEPRHMDWRATARRRS